MENMTAADWEKMIHTFLENPSGKGIRSLALNIKYFGGLREKAGFDMAKDMIQKRLSEMRFDLD